MLFRSAQIKRTTGETRIRLKLEIDGKGRSKVDTGLPFFDHMLTLFAKHAVGELAVTLRWGSGSGCASHGGGLRHRTRVRRFCRHWAIRTGIRRYGTGFDPRNPLTGEAHVPMDECLARCVIDFSGRPYLVWRGARFTQLQSDPGREDAGSLERLSFRAGARILSGFQRTQRAAICTWSCFMGKNHIMWRKSCSNHLPKLSITPASAIPASPGRFRARKGCSEIA